MSTIAEQLAAQGLRLAHPNEAGWYVLVDDDGPVRVWATDAEPEEVRGVRSFVDADDLT